MYAIIETGSKQYRVEKDTVLSVEKLPTDKGGKVTFDRVLRKRLTGTPWARLVAASPFSGSGRG